MSDELEVILLAGRLGLDDDGWPLTPLLDRLERRGVLARVVCLANRGEADDDPRILEVPALGNRWLRSFVVRRLVQETLPRQPQLIHVVHDEAAEIALVLADISRLPYVQSINDFESLERGLRLSRRWFRKLIAASGELADELIERLGVPTEHLTVIPPGVCFQPDLARRDGRRPVPVIGAAGPLVESSGFGAFLEAARIVLNSGYEAEFLVASQGEDEIDLRRRAQTLKISDRVTVADYAIAGSRFWTVLDVYCQPTLVPNSGRTLILALARGIPSIAANVTGLRMLIDHGRSGLIVPPDRSEALAAAMIELLDHPERAAHLGQSAQAVTLARFDPETEADRLADLYWRSAVPSSSTPT